MNSSLVTLHIEDDIAIVTIDNPPVNATSHAVRAELAEVISQTNKNHSLLAVILTCAGSTFVAGADIKEFGKPPQSPSLPSIINDIENARIPWVAAVNGAALGGGLELALACRYRLAVEGASVGFPEVNLGLIPGAGGTVRLPRLITMQEAVNLITSGKPINALKAKHLGLIDEVFPADLLASAKAFTRSHVMSSDRLPTCHQDIIEPLSSTAIEKAISTAESRRQFAKAAAIDTISRGSVMPVKEAAALEVETFQNLRESDQSKALRHLFFAERSVSKVTALKGVEPRDITRVGVVGGGTMGAGIASSALLSDLNVTLVERDEAAAQSAQRNVEKILQSSLSRGIISQEKHQRALDKFTATVAFNALSDADLVIEAVFEDLEVKKQVFMKLDEVTKSTAILATNTSYFDVATIANQTKDPSRVVGLHYFSPAHIMKLLEVIRTDFVSPDVLATALKFAKITGKIAVPARCCKGFIGNRIMSAYRQTSEYLIEDGALPHQVDSAMKNFGFPLGIFEMQDLAGLDIGWAMRKQLTDAEKNDTRYVDIADKICETNRFGRKTGSGYYKYEDGKTALRYEWVEELIIAESARKGIVRRPFTDSEIITTILQRLSNEANSILQERIADSPEAIDVVMVNGFGFPRWRGGPMYSS